jgi:hypothetical protein
MLIVLSCDPSSHPRHILITSSCVCVVDDQVEIARRTLEALNLKTSIHLHYTLYVPSSTNDIDLSFAFLSQNQ